ncbi:helix-turn-helix domain-containing protein [Granulicella paludicola]|uniref:helix-turn-helix domain-containing protein n=1 Tax=Granulicella paludicola TaxID=474951 RepID=UPI0021E000E5|nr:helix-turn-helix transcriptional regulator [Granulicella paludicola]
MQKALRHLTIYPTFLYTLHVKKWDAVGPLTRPQTINRLFGQRLAAARRGRKISQSELGRRMNRSRVSIANIESGRASVQLSQVFQLADAISASVDELIPDDRAIRGFEASSSGAAFIQSVKAQLGEIAAQGAKQ